MVWVFRFLAIFCIDFSAPTPQKCPKSESPAGRPGTASQVNVQVVCSTSAPPGPRPAPPAIPTWKPNWNLTESTVIQPGGCDLSEPTCRNGAGIFRPKHTWGLVSLDWGVGDSVCARACVNLISSLTRPLFRIRGAFRRTQNPCWFVAGTTK